MCRCPVRLAFAKQTHISHPRFRLWITSLEEIEAFDSPARRMNVVGVILGKPSQNRCAELLKISEYNACIFVLIMMLLYHTRIEC